MDASSANLVPLMTAEEVGGYLRKTRKAVYEMVHKGEIPDSCIIRLGRQLRFDPAAIQQWVQGKKGK